MQYNFEELYKNILYEFKNIELLKSALSHPSLCYSKKNKCSNYERLELLGDSVLSLVILEMLLNYYKDLDEGEISKRKSYLVCTRTLANIGQTINLGKFIFMTKGEEKLDGRNNPKILENVTEAIIGAMYLDGGLDVVKTFIKKYWFKLIEGQQTIKKDPKSRLQEWSQKNKYGIPEYNVINTYGSNSNPIFKMEISLANFNKFTDTATTKKEAEVKCAKKMIKYIKNNIDKKI